MLLIVGSCEPLYEAEFTQSNAPKQSEETAHLNQFILHSAMDMVDMAMEEKADMCASRPRHSRRDARNAAGTCASSTSSTTRTSSRTSRRDRSSSGREPNDSANSFERSVEKRPRREHTTRPKMSRNDFDSTEIEVSLDRSDAGQVPAAPRGPQRGRRAQLLPRGPRALREARHEPVLRARHAHHEPDVRPRGPRARAAALVTMCGAGESEGRARAHLSGGSVLFARSAAVSVLMRSRPGRSVTERWSSSTT